MYVEEEIYDNPLKVFEFTNCLGQYDWSMTVKYMLNWEVCDLATDLNHISR